MRGGSKAVQNFSENSSVFETPPVPYNTNTTPEQPQPLCPGLDGSHMTTTSYKGQGWGGGGKDRYILQMRCNIFYWIWSNYKIQEYIIFSESDKTMEAWNMWWILDRITEARNTLLINSEQVLITEIWGCSFLPARVELRKLHDWKPRCCGDLHRQWGGGRTG